MNQTNSNKGIARFIPGIVIFSVGFLLGLWWGQGESPLQIELHVPLSLEFCVVIPSDVPGTTQNFCYDLALQRDQSAPQNEGGTSAPIPEEVCNEGSTDKPTLVITNDTPYSITFTMTGATSYQPLVIPAGEVTGTWVLDPGAYQYTAIVNAPNVVPLTQSAAYFTGCTYTLALFIR